MADTDRPGVFIPAAALVSLLLVDTLRVWFPAVLIGIDASAPTRGTLAIGVATLAPLVAWAVPRRAVPGAWLGSVGLLLLARLLLQGNLGLTGQAIASSVALTAAGVAIGILASGARSSATTRFSVLIGFAAAGAIHAGLGMTDLAWRDGAAAWLTLLVQLGATGAAAWTLRSSLLTGADRSDAAWPWWLFGPILLLLGVLVLVPGRVATSTRWSDPWVAAVIVVAAGLLVVAVLIGRWLGPSLAGPAGAALTLVGTAGSLQTTSVVAVISQLCLAAGLGLVVASCDRVQGELPPRRLAVAAAGIPTVFCLLAVAYYAGYGVNVAFPNRIVLLLVSALVAIGALWAGAARDADALRERGLLRQVANATAATASLALLAALSVDGAERGPAEVGSPDAPIRVVLANLHSGYDQHGRYAVDRLGDMLAEQEPDIVVLNEVDRGWMVTGGRDTLRQLSGTLGMSYVFGPAADEVWGNAILSRYPVTESTVERLPRGAEPMDRTQLIAVIEVAPEDQIAVIATHLSEVDRQGDTRLPQARSIAATMVRLRDRGVPVLLAGSLNAEPDDAEWTTLTDTTRSVLPRGHPTRPASDPTDQVDHILTTEEFRLRDAEVLEVELSERRPMVAVLELMPAD